MEELEQILRSHGAKYPLMEPTDAVKLIYQNEFGGGHLIRDPEKCLQRLRQEYRVTPQKEDTLLEPIGNGMVRVMLEAMDANGYSLEALGKIFLQSAGAHQGNLPVFLQKLELLRKVTKAGVFGFTSEALEEYLAEYKKAGYPMVSHSRRYREAYHPAYRVVEQKLVSMIDICK